jgi:hypothetical protein
MIKMSDGRTSGITEGFGDSGISSILQNIGYPALELKSKQGRIGKIKPTRKRRIYQLGIEMPCQENDEECKDGHPQDRQRSNLY